MKNQRQAGVAGSVTKIPCEPAKWGASLEWSIVLTVWQTATVTEINHARGCAWTAAGYPLGQPSPHELSPHTTREKAIILQARPLPKGQAGQGLSPGMADEEAQDEPVISPRSRYVGPDCRS